MEDVLAVYTRPHDPDRPLVCLDETSKQLIGETRVPIPMKAGRPARCDYEYKRNGTALQNTAAGSISPSPNVAFYRPSASTAASPINNSSSRRSPPGNTTAMQTTPRPIGTSQPPTHVSNSSTCTLQSD